MYRLLRLGVAGRLLGSRRSTEGAEGEDVSSDGGRIDEPARTRAGCRPGSPRRMGAWGSLRNADVS